MYIIFMNFLSIVGGIVMIPTTIIILDCMYVYLSNTSVDLNRGVRTPITGLMFTVGG